MVRVQAGHVDARLVVRAGDGGARGAQHSGRITEGSTCSQGLWVTQANTTRHILLCRVAAP